ncbi:myosin-M heavy chain-like [Carassius auratus]|uniref:Myosin-M heavy chain-like n=1 Tax=Carassius auratus TaxID=7957 RepID=A0A6P6J334_CARAU|nr:myosin-M heavy chain-like [Carassius auratus]
MAAKLKKKKKKKKTFKEQCINGETLQVNRAFLDSKKKNEAVTSTTTSTSHSLTTESTSQPTTPPSTPQSTTPAQTSTSDSTTTMVNIYSSSNISNNPCTNIHVSYNNIYISLTNH